MNNVQLFDAEIPTFLMKYESRTSNKRLGSVRSGKMILRCSGIRWNLRTKFLSHPSRSVWPSTRGPLSIPSWIPGLEFWDSRGHGTPRPAQRISPCRFAASVEFKPRHNAGPLWIPTSAKLEGWRAPFSSLWREQNGPAMLGGRREWISHYSTTNCSWYSINWTTFTVNFATVINTRRTRMLTGGS